MRPQEQSRGKLTGQWVPHDTRDEVVDIGYYTRHPLDGYRRLAFMMLDADMVAVSPSTMPSRTSVTFRLPRPRAGRFRPAYL